MKPRVNQKPVKKNSWTPKYSTKGDMEFIVRGYVQEVTASEERDFVVFKIDNPYVEDNVNIITIECAWSLPQLEAGDHVEVKGNIRSWWKKEYELITHSFVAEEINQIKETKGRGRLNNNPVEDITEADPIGDD